MTVVCPTITAEETREYNRQLSRIRTIVPRIHIDLADDLFTPRQLISPGQVHFPKELITDIHIMVEEPAAHLMTLISLQPHLVVIHCEAKGDLKEFMQNLQKVDIKAGIALLPDTEVKDAEEFIAIADHVLIFAGHLGYQGGKADMKQAEKIAQVRALKAGIEIGWDGGVNLENAPTLAAAGVDVLNVGGYIQNATDPQAAYLRLTEAIQG